MPCSFLRLKIKKALEEKCPYTGFSRKCVSMEKNKDRGTASVVPTEEYCQRSCQYYSFSRLYVRA